MQKQALYGFRTDADEMKFAWRSTFPRRMLPVRGTKNGMVYRKEKTLENPISLTGSRR